MALLEDQFATQAGHWYKPDGTAAYRIVGANGKERNTTLADARKLGLLPSVTTILRQEAKPQLEQWKVQQAMLAVLTLPRLPGESIDDFMPRALRDSREQAYKAAEKGTFIHGLLEERIRRGSPQVKERASDAAIIDPVIAWLDVNFGGYVWEPERSFASEHGFGGKLDLHGFKSGEPGEFDVVIDFKVKAGITPDKKLAYDEHATQLAAYSYGLGRPWARCLNLFIDSETPGVMVPVEWPKVDIDDGWKAFSHLLGLWKVRKGIA